MNQQMSSRFTDPLTHGGSVVGDSRRAECDDGGQHGNFFTREVPEQFRGRPITDNDMPENWL